MDMDVIHPRKYKKKCAVCGNEFMGWNKKQKFCGEECKRKNELRMGEIYRERARLKTKENKTVQKKKQALNDISMAARNAGMTYGQYVARMGL